jgi:carbohydrate diacid regulator
MQNRKIEEAITMSSRIFQSVVLQMKDSTDRAIGVIDSEGTVVACNELTSIGERWPGSVEAVNSAGGDCIVLEGKTFKTLTSWNSQFDYAVFVRGEDEQARLVCSMAVVALNGAKSYYEEKHDKATFVKSIISDNILLGDIYVRAKELHFVSEMPRAVFLVRQTGEADVSAIDVIQSLFPDKQVDFVLSTSETDVTLIKQLGEGADGRDLHKIAKQIEDALAEELNIKAVIGIGTVVTHIRDLARAHKEAQVAIDVGKVFETEKSIINYENLGIGRLIYQLPTTLCEMFLQEVFKKNPIDALDQETLFTINKFFENNLNVSETARKLFVHRNTLVYRLEKIKKLTGLDLREFDDAITFKVALMVKKYLISRGIES